MRYKSIIVLLALFSAVVALSPSQTQAATSDDATARCAALGSVDFSHLQDAPTQIVGAKLLEGGAGRSAACQVGYVTPNVGFQLRLPVTAWNGKFIETRMRWVMRRD